MSDGKREEPESYCDFAARAEDERLSEHEKIGFPDSYRKGFASIIFQDIAEKIPAICENGKTILDIGSGCGELSETIVRESLLNAHRVYLVDSKEMLARVAENKDVRKIAGRFPSDCSDFIREHREQFDVIVSYSVFHYVVKEGDIYRFLDEAVSLLAPGGAFLLGDIPNLSMRNRLFSSDEGHQYHRKHFPQEVMPEPEFAKLRADMVDDGMILGILARYRNYGFNSYIVPQGKNLPMSNRREDIIITRYS